MLIETTEFTLKDGRTATIRNASECDIEGMLEYLRVSASETEFILRYPEECSRYTYDVERAYIERVNASPNDCMLVCEVGGKIAGNCQIAFNVNIKTRHRAAVAIALMSEFWNLGIGTRLFTELIRVAELRPEVLQLELEYVEGNVRARHMYEKMGFRTVGVRPDAIRLKDGTLLSEYLMIKRMHG